MKIQVDIPNKDIQEIEDFITKIINIEINYSLEPNKAVLRFLNVVTRAISQEELKK